MTCNVPLFYWNGRYCYIEIAQSKQYIVRWIETSVSYARSLTPSHHLMQSTHTNTESARWNAFIRAIKTKYDLWHFICQYYCCMRTGNYTHNNNNHFQFIYLCLEFHVCVCVRVFAVYYHYRQRTIEIFGKCHDYYCIRSIR